LQYDHTTSFAMPDGEERFSYKDLELKWKRGIVHAKLVTLEGPLGLFGVDHNGQMVLIDAGENSISFTLADDTYNQLVVRAPKLSEVTLNLRALGQGQEQDPVPAQPIVDEVEEDSVEDKILKALRRFIPSEDHVAQSFDAIADIIEQDDEQNFGPDGDEDVDLDLLFLEQGPAALVAEFEKRALAAKQEEEQPPEPPAPEPPAPEPPAPPSE